MAQRIKPDVLQALQDWKAGKPVKSLELGHVHRMTLTEGEAASYPNTRNSIDLSKRLYNDQERAHAYCFAVIDFEQSSADHTFEEFLLSCQMVRKRFPEVTHEEALAAESLAWKALHVGWTRAIAGHAEHQYIEVTNPAIVQSSTLNPLGQGASVASPLSPEQRTPAPESKEVAAK